MRGSRKATAGAATLVAAAALVLTAPVAAQVPDAVRGVERTVIDVRNPEGPVQKLLLTRPAGATQPLPAILVLPWMDCSSLAIPAEKLHGFQQLMRHLVEDSGMVVARIEKPGVGGSTGDCGDTDFETELEGYRAALTRLRDEAWAGDTIILVGQSFSGGVLPLVAQDTPAAGYVVVSSWVRTWLERLLEFERNRMIRAGTSPAEIANRMRAFSRLYGVYLNDRVTPEQAIDGRADLAAVWTGPGTHQYGRPAAFFHQLQALNLEAAWSAVTVPTLLLWGDADIAMHRRDHQRIADLVNANRPGTATLQVVRGGDHTLLVGGELGPDAIPALDRWLRRFAPR